MAATAPSNSNGGGAAGALGTRLLGEVQEEGLDEFLRAFCHLYDPLHAARLPVPALDAVLNPPGGAAAGVGTTTSTTGVTTTAGFWNQGAGGFSSTWSSQVAGQAQGTTKPPGPAMLCITGPSCAGKTQLLYSLAAAAVLDPRGAAVVVLDVSGRFDVLRLAAVVRQRIEEDEGEGNVEQLREPACGDNPGDDAEERDQFIRTALHHVHLFRPQSSASLLATVRQLEGYLLHGTHPSRGRRLAAILLDGAGAFFWQDRAEGAAGARESEVFAALRRVQEAFACPLVVTGPAGFRPRVGDGVRVVRLRVQKERVVKFGPAMSVEEAKVEQEKRWEVVRRGRFVGWDEEQRRVGLRFWVREGVGFGEEREESDGDG